MVMISDRSDIRFDSYGRQTTQKGAKKNYKYIDICYFFR